MIAPNNSGALNKGSMVKPSRRTDGNVRPADALLARFLLDCHRVLSREENKELKKSDETVFKTLGGAGTDYHKRR